MENSSREIDSSLHSRSSTRPRRWNTVYRLINGRYAAMRIPQIPALIQFTRGIRAVHASFPRVAVCIFPSSNFYFTGVVGSHSKHLNFNLIISRTFWRNFLQSRKLSISSQSESMRIYRICKSIFRLSNIGSIYPRIWNRYESNNISNTRLSSYC